MRAFAAASSKLVGRQTCDILNKRSRLSVTSGQQHRCQASVTEASCRADLTPELNEVLSRVTPRLFIDGQFVDANGGATFDTLDPRTGRSLISVAEAQQADVDKAVQAARIAFDHEPWPRMSGRERGRIMHKFADLMQGHAEELAMLESLDNGKPLRFSRNVDLPIAISQIRYFAGMADKINGRIAPTAGAMQALVYKEPLGVVGQIIPWNFPLMMQVGHMCIPYYSGAQAMKLGPALAVGNTVVMKVAEQTPLSALRVGELALQSGIPPGVVNILTGDGQAGAALAAHPGVDKIAFTGSTAVGRQVMKAAAENLKPVTLELGGKSPMIVCADANVDKAVQFAHDAVFFNAGQACLAASRTFVHASIYDEFVEKAAARAERTRVGDPFDRRTDQGPQVSEKQLHRVVDYVQCGIEDGAELLTGGSRHSEPGYYMQPTVFADVQDDMVIAREEIFGPVQSILKWDSLEEVIERANATHYGLAGGVCSRNVDTINTLTRAMKAGVIWVNGNYGMDDVGVPFGGYKQSGIGREGGPEVLEQYTQTKSVYMPLKAPIAWQI